SRRRLSGSTLTNTETTLSTGTSCAATGADESAQARARTTDARPRTRRARGESDGRGDGFNAELAETAEFFLVILIFLKELSACSARSALRSSPRSLVPLRRGAIVSSPPLRPLFPGREPR